MGTEEDNLEIILNSKDYSFLEGKLKSQFREQALIVMARLDFERTLPYLKGRLKSIPQTSYEWKGKPLRSYDSQLDRRDENKKRIENKSKD